MKKQIRNRGAVFCAALTVLLFGLAVFAGCRGVNGETKNNEPKSSVEGAEMKDVFPSILEDFDLAEFTEAFFENNTLILVPFEWSGQLGEYLDFYTVFAENGKLNFLVEVTHPYGATDAGFDFRLFVIVIPNEIFGKYEIGEMIVFETYDFSSLDWSRDPIVEKKPREWLSGIQEKSVEHRVGLYPRYGEGFNPDPKRVFLYLNKITVVDSVESLQEHLVVNTAE